MSDWEYSERDKDEISSSIKRVEAAIAEYHDTMRGKEAPPNSMPMSFIVVYSATFIDDDGRQKWGNHMFGTEDVDPNTLHGLASWGLGVTDTSSEAEGE